MPARASWIGLPSSDNRKAGVCGALISLSSSLEPYGEIMLTYQWYYPKHILTIGILNIILTLCWTRVFIMFIMKLNHTHIKANMFLHITYSTNLKWKWMRKTHGIRTRIIKSYKIWKNEKLKQTDVCDINVDINDDIDDDINDTTPVTSMCL